MTTAEVARQWVQAKRGSRAGAEWSCYRRCARRSLLQLASGFERFGRCRLKSSADGHQIGDVLKDFGSVVGCIRVGGLQRVFVQHSLYASEAPQLRLSLRTQVPKVRRQDIGSGGFFRVWSHGASHVVRLRARTL